MHDQHTVKHPWYVLKASLKAESGYLCWYSNVPSSSSLPTQARTATSVRWRPSQSQWEMTRGVAAMSQATCPSCSPATKCLGCGGWRGRWCLPVTHYTGTASQRTRLTSSLTLTTTREATSPTIARWGGGCEGWRGEGECVGWVEHFIICR